MKQIIAQTDFDQAEREGRLVCVFDKSTGDHLHLLRDTMWALTIIRLILALASTSEVYAGTADSNRGRQEDLDERGLRVVEGPPFVRSVSVGGLRVHLEKTTFAQIQKALGEGHVITSGDAGEFMARLCYRTSDSRKPVYIVFESGELGGGTDVEGFELFGAGARPDLEASCGVLRIPAEKIRVDGTFSPSVSKREIASRFGLPQGANGDTLFYRHDRSHRTGSLPSDSDWEETSFVDVAFEGQQLTWMRAWKVSAY